MGGKGALNYLPIVPKASIYVPKVMRKPVMGGNQTYGCAKFRHQCLRLELSKHTGNVSLRLRKCVKFRKLAQAVNFERDG